MLLFCWKTKCDRCSAWIGLNLCFIASKRSSQTWIAIAYATYAGVNERLLVSFVADDDILGARGRHVIGRIMRCSSQSSPSCAVIGSGRRGFTWHAEYRFARTEFGQLQPIRVWQNVRNIEETGVFAAPERWLAYMSVRLYPDFDFC